jgi:hypothetical protein
VFVAFAAADMDAMDITMQNLTNIQSVFDISDMGSTLMVENFAARDIRPVNPNALWIGFNLRDGAKGTLTNSSFFNSTNSQHLYSASNMATLDIQGSMVTGVSGGRVVVSRVAGLAQGLGNGI